MSKTSSQVKNRWNEKNYDRITIMAKKGKKEEWKQKAKDNGFSSLNSYLIDCIDNIPSIQAHKVCDYFLCLYVNVTAV